jgi:hypothetical protein
MATLVVQQHRSRKRSSLLQGITVVRGRSRDGVRVGMSVELGFGVVGVADEEGEELLAILCGRFQDESHV